MTKRIIALLFALVICVFSVMPAFAESELPRLIDNSDVLTDEEETEPLAGHRTAGYLYCLLRLSVHTVICTFSISLLNIVQQAFSFFKILPHLYLHRAIMRDEN